MKRKILFLIQNLLLTQAVKNLIIVNENCGFRAFGAPEKCNVSFFRRKYVEHFYYQGCCRKGRRRPLHGIQIHKRRQRPRKERHRHPRGHSGAGIPGEPLCPEPQVTAQPRHRRIAARPVGPLFQRNAGGP